MKYFCWIRCFIISFLLLGCSSSFPETLHLNEDSQRFIFQFIRNIPACDLELVFVASRDLLWKGCPCYLRNYGLSFASFANLEGFLSLDSKWSNLLPHCIVILPSGPRGSRQIIQTMDHYFKSWPLKRRMPTMIILWPEIHHRQNVSLQDSILKEVYDGTAFSFNSDVYSVFLSHQRVSNSFKASIWETYSIKNAVMHQRLDFKSDLINRNGILEEQDHGALEIMNYDDLNKKVERRRDFREAKITLTARDETMDSTWLRLRNISGKITLTGGQNAFWYWDLQRMLNFTMEIILGDSIILLKNQSLAGITYNQLKDGRADFSMTTSLVVEFRAKQLTFLQPTYESLIQAYFAQPLANSIRNIVTGPFDNKLWLCIVGTWLFLILTVKWGSWLLLRGSVTVEAETVYDKRNHDKEFAKSVGMWAIAANCQKSWYTIPSSISLKMMFVVGAFCGVLFYVAYSAAIVSSLATTIIPVQKFMDLIQQNFILTVHKRSEPFKDILRHLIQLHNLPQDVVTVEEHQIDQLLEKNWERPKAFLGYQDLFYQTAKQMNYTEGFICKTISNVKASQFRYKSANVVNKGSEFTEIFNHKIIQLRERGFNYRYVDNYEKESILQCNSNLIGSKQTEAILFTDVFTAFLVIFIGLLISSLGLIYELAFKKMSSLSRDRLSNCKQ